MSDCIQRVNAIFNDVLLRPVGSPHTDLMETGILDSLALVELLFNLEQQFGLTLDISSLDLDHFRSVTAIAELVSSRSDALANSGRR